MFDQLTVHLEGDGLQPATFGPYYLTPRHSAMARGEIGMVDMLGSDAASTNAKIGDAASIWANVVEPTRLAGTGPSFFLVAMEDIAVDKRGPFMLAAPKLKVLVNRAGASTGALTAFQSMTVNTNGHLLQDPVSSNLIVAINGTSTATITQGTAQLLEVGYFCGIPQNLGIQP